MTQSRLPWPNSSGRRRRGGFSLVEVVVTILIVGGLMAAALNTVGASRLTQYNTNQRSRALALGQSLMAEILQQDYEEPDTPGSFGLEGAENSTKRDLYDDIDDYAGWSASPPEDKDGALVENTTGFRRLVTVKWVDTSDPDVESVLPTGMKGITVVVTCQDREMVRLFAIRTDAWPQQADVLEAGN